MNCFAGQFPPPFNKIESSGQPNPLADCETVSVFQFRVEVTNLLREFRAIPPQIPEANFFQCLARLHYNSQNPWRAPGSPKRLHGGIFRLGYRGGERFRLNG